MNLERMIKLVLILNDKQIISRLPESDLWIKFWKRPRQTKQIPGTLVMNIDVMLFSKKPNNHKKCHNDVVDLNANHRQEVLVDG